MTSSETPEGPGGIGPRLAAARSRRGLAQVAVARDAGLAPSYLSRIENGKVQPTFRTVMNIARVLGAAPSELVEPPARHATPRRVCPVTTSGQCLLDLAGNRSDPDHFTPREVRLLRRFSIWIKSVPANRLRAMELLLEDMTPPKEDASSARGTPALPRETGNASSDL